MVFLLDGSPLLSSLHMWICLLGLFLWNNPSKTTRKISQLNGVVRKLVILLFLTPGVASFTSYQSIVGKRFLGSALKSMSSRLQKDPIIKVSIAGWTDCGAFQEAKQALKGISTIFPNKFLVTVNESKLFSI